MKKIAIVYHSGFGHTEVIARHVFEGAKAVIDISAELFKATDITDKPEVLNDYDAIIMGAPTYMGSLSAGLKSFMEASSLLWMEQKWKDKIAAGFTNSHSLSGDKLDSLLQLVVFAAQHGMIWVGQAEMNHSPDGKAGQPEAINRIGSWVGLMAQSENAPPAETPPIGDRETAERFGRRVAEITKNFNLAKR
ncbi:MAG: flavodoxin family protein [Francisellaceae bacterium]